MGGGGVGHSKGVGVFVYPPPQWGYLVRGGGSCSLQMGGGGAK